MTKSDDKRVPVLRFKGFTDEWEQRKLSTFVKKINLSSSAKIPNVNYEDISSNTGILNKKVSELSTGKKGIRFDKDDILFGKLRPYLNNYIITNFSGIAVGDFWVLRSLESSIFLFYLIQSPKFKYISNISSGSKMPRSDWNLVSNFHFNIPNNIEQNNIGRFLQLIDKLITLQQRKEKQIKLLKKAMLQTLFTTKNIPQLRFKGFTDNWEQHKLNSFLVEYKKKTKINNQYPVLTSSRQGIFFQKDYYDGNQIASKNNIGYNIVPRNYFTYRHMSDDTIFHFNINTLCDYGIVSTLYPVFTTNNQLSSSWLYYYLNYGNDMKRYALLQKQGGSRTYMYLSKLKNMSGHIPSVKEQDNVAKMLLKIDNLIALQQNKTKKLENLKQFLLQNMFI